MCKNKYPSYNNFNLNNKDEIWDKNGCIPKSLFKYTKVKYANDLLNDNLMYLSEITELNDPYEGELLYDKELIKNAYYKHKQNEFDKQQLNKKIDIKTESYLRELKKYIHEGIYVLCLSGCNNINPLWAHYAENHQGICIEYDVKNSNDMFIRDSCFKMEYVVDNDVTSKIKSNINSSSVDLNLKLKPFLRKSFDWNYEQEWRIIIDEKDIPDSKLVTKSKKKYLKFLKPAAVYLGLKITKEDETYIRGLCKENEIDVLKANKNNKTYGFDFM